MSFYEARRFLSVAATGCAILAGSLEARAATCAATPALTSGGATILYGAGGSSQLELIQSIATQYAQLSPPVYILYWSGAACTGYNYFATPNSIPAASVDYWTASGTQESCTLAGGETVTFAVMGNTPALCNGVTWPSAGIAQFDGPAQTLDFVVPGGPTGSSQKSISTEAAYYVWGFFASDANHTVTPWSTPDNIFTRSSTSFVSTFLALDLTSALGSSLGVSAVSVSGAGAPDGGSFGTSESTTQLTVTKLAALSGTAGAESGIGLVSGETADENRAAVNILAYQHTGQTCGYLPDSTPDLYDKANVRSGQYWLWTPIHFFAAVGAGGAITDPATASFVGLFTGATTNPPPGIDVFNAEVSGAFTVPQCAMQAWRDGDLGAPYSYAPAIPCSCKFDIAVGNPNKAATCTTCAQDSDCSTNHCRNVGTPLPSPPGDDAGANDNPDAGAVGYCEAY